MDAIGGGAASGVPVRGLSRFTGTNWIATRMAASDNPAVRALGICIAAAIIAGRCRGPRCHAVEDERTPPGTPPALPSADLGSQFGEIDIYLFDQLLKGRFDRRRTVLDAGC